jgi:hypothetical protein
MSGRLAHDTGDTPRQEPSPRRSSRRTLALRLLAVGLSLVVAEVVLQVLVWLCPGTTAALLPPHRRLQRLASRPSRAVRADDVPNRGNPDFPTHDEWGYPKTPSSSPPTVIAIGDSQTYGPTDDPNGAWPAQLATRTDLSAYNMSLGGWGPVAYATVLTEAIARDPEAILIAIYLGNDLFDAYRAVYLQGYRQDLRCAELAPRLQAIEQATPFEPQILRAAGYVSAPRSPVPSAAGTDGDPAGNGMIAEVRSLLSQHCRLYGLARWFKDQVRTTTWPQAAEAAEAQRSWQQQIDWTQRHADISIAWEVGDHRTILLPDYRHLALDQEAPRIQAGLSIVEQVLVECADRCQASGISFGILILPTKESVFAADVQPADGDPRLTHLRSEETTVRLRLASHLEQHGIAYVDALPHLQAALREGPQPYAPNRDGHPNAHGYEAIARAAQVLLDQLGYDP